MTDPNLNLNLYLAQKALAKKPLTRHDWGQLEQAAIGCTSGIENWPALRLAIQKVVASKRGHKLKVCT